jgi:hypothetical protein
MPIMSIIVTGQIRTFFNKEFYNSFLNMLNNTSQHYDKIYLFFIISGEYDEDKFGYFFHINKVITKIIKFNTQEADKAILEKANNPTFKRIAEDYMNSNCDEKYELPNPFAYMRTGIYQFYQLKIGIEEIEKLEEHPDIIMKTRFDTRTHPEFYPMVYPANENPVQKIEYNNSIKNLMGIASMTEHINWLKSFPVNSTYRIENCQVNERKSFGIAYCYNYKAPENILNGSDDILYCLNDFTFWGRADIFKKLKTLFDEYGMFERDRYIYHLYCQESQLLAFCFRNGINPLMYWNV